MRHPVGVVPYLFCRLLFWLLAVGMASELPLGSSWPESARAARTVDLRDSLFAAAPAVIDDDCDSGSDQQASFDTPDICDEAGLPRLDCMQPGRLASVTLVEHLAVAPARPPTARQMARAPPFLILG